MSDNVYLAYDYPVLGAFWTAMWVFLWVLWVFLLFRIIVDIFRDDRMNGWAKTGWLLFVLLLPFLGVFVYVVARGAGMGRREQEHAQASKREFDEYVRETAASGGGGRGRGNGQAEELARLAELRSAGHLSDAEFQRAKERVLN